MITVFAKKALLPSGWASDVRLEVSDGLVSHIEANASAAPGDEAVGYIIPGLCNAHSHAFQRALAGHTDSVRLQVAIISGAGANACTNWPVESMQTP